MELFQEPEFTDLSLADLSASEQMLKDSLFTVGRMAGLSDDQITAQWEEIQQNAQTQDIHIDELQHPRHSQTNNIRANWTYRQ